MFEPFVVAPPEGMRIRTSVRVTDGEHEVLAAVGEHLGGLAGRDLAARCALGAGSKHLGRAERKKSLTAASSSRWAGSITRTSADQWERGWLNLLDRRKGLSAAVSTVSRRLAAPVGGKAGGVRGYATTNERRQKAMRLERLKDGLAEVEARIESGRVSVCRGGVAMARKRQNLDAAGMTEGEWRAEWEASRWFFSADGDAVYPHGNGLIWVDPDTGGAVSHAAETFGASVEHAWQAACF